MKIDPNTNRDRARDKPLVLPREEYMECESDDRHIVHKVQLPVSLQHDSPENCTK